MNKAVLLRISIIIISILLHAGVFFLSFSVAEPEETEPLPAVIQLIDAVIIEEPAIIQAQPPPLPEEVIEEINEAVIPDESLEEPPEDPEPAELKAEPVESPGADSPLSSESSVQQTETAYIPFYRVERRPEFISRGELDYPLNAKRSRIEGTVIIEADIDNLGVLQGTKIIKSAGFGFDEAAASMLENSTFSPAVMDGRQVGVRMRFTIKFEL